MSVRDISGKLKRNPRLFAFGTVIGLIMLSIALASVPRGSKVTDDTALYQKVSEIQLPHEPAPNFDAEIARLTQIEGQYRETPAVRRARQDPLRDPKIAGPLRRVSARKYRQ